MATRHYIEDANLSIAWVRAVLAASLPGHRECAPLVVSITGFKDRQFLEDPTIRASLDQLLQREKKESVHTVANTIFPISLWQPTAPRRHLFDRYLHILPRIRASSVKNKRGVYFERMITNGPQGRENQLDFGIRTYSSRKGFRRGVLQIATFDPHQDHSAAARLGFPCLQHVTFAPTRDGLNVNAFYATQYMVARAYGNYVGLCRLGAFVAHELRMPLSRVTCFAGIAELDLPKKSLDPFRSALRTAAPTAAVTEEAT